MVGVPFKMVDKKRTASPELLKTGEREGPGIRHQYAIHNHGPDMPELFPNAKARSK
jgi:hypothetical protein